MHLDDRRSNILRDALLLQGKIRTTTCNESDEELQQAGQNEEQLPLVHVGEYVVLEALGIFAVIKVGKDWALDGLELEDVEQDQRDEGAQLVIPQACRWWVQRVWYLLEEIEREADFKHEHGDCECLIEELAHQRCHKQRVILPFAVLEAEVAEQLQWQAFVNRQVTPLWILLLKLLYSAQTEANPRNEFDRVLFAQLRLHEQTDRKHDWNQNGDVLDCFLCHNKLLVYLAVDYVGVFDVKVGADAIYSTPDESLLGFIPVAAARLVVHEQHV